MRYVVLSAMLHAWGSSKAAVTILSCLKACFPPCLGCCYGKCTDDVACKFMLHWSNLLLLTLCKTLLAGDELVRCCSGNAGEPALKTTLTKQERRHQEHAIDMLLQHCKTLQAWDTSLETDEQLLTSPGLTSRHRQAISARLEYKRVIQAACSALETYKCFVKDAIMLSRLVQT